MLLPFVLAAHAHTLDLRFAAAPVSQVVATIAEASGEHLDVDPAVGKEIVALRLPNVTPKKAMRLLVDGLDATWQPSENGLLLTRTSNQVAEERKAYERLIREGYRRSLAKLPPLPAFDARRYAEASDTMIRDLNSEELPTPSGASSFSDAYNFCDSNGPIARLGRRLMEGLSEDLANEMSGKRVVFHSSPNRQQQKTSPLIDEALRRYRFERAQVRELGALEVENQRNRTVNDLEVVFKRSVGYVQYRLLDTNGEPIGGGVTVCVSPDLSFKIEIANRAEDTALLRYPTPVLEAATRAFASQAPFPPDVEPLRDVGANLVRWSEARKEPLVAVLGDNLLGLPSTPFEGYDPLTQISQLGYSIHEKDGTLWMIPLDRIGVRRKFADRSALRAMIQTVQRQQTLTIADYFRFADRLPKVEENPYIYSWLGSLGFHYAYWNTSLLHLAMGLPSNRTVPLASLPPALQNDLRDAVWADGPGDHRDHMLSVCGSGTELEPDATDELPDGISANAPVRLDETREPCFVMDGTKELEPAIWTVSEIERYKPEFQESHWVRLGTCHWLDLTISLGNGLFYKDRIETVENLGPATPVAQLPRSLLNAVRWARAQSSSTQIKMPENL